MEAIHRDYAPKGVRFFYLYKSLAHPESGGYVQPFTLEERLMHVKEAEKRIGGEIPWLCDTITNDLMHALGNAPTSEFVIDPEGKIVRKRAWGSAKLLRKYLEELVGPVENPTKADDLKLKIAPAPKVAARNVVKPITVPRAMKPLVLKPEFKEGDTPFYAKLRADADESLLQSGNGKLYLGFHLDPIYRVHWNNLTETIHVEIESPDGVAIPTSLDGPKVEEPADVDPREFLVDVSGWTSAEPMRLTVRYFGCSDEPAFCIPVTQRYTIHRRLDLDSGWAKARIDPVGPFLAAKPEIAVGRVVKVDVDAAKLVLATADDKTLEFRIDRDTRFTREDDRKKLSDLKTNDEIRVAFFLRKEGALARDLRAKHTESGSAAKKPSTTEDVKPMSHAGVWPAFRGPSGNGISTARNVPLTWGPENNIKWRAELPEPGDSSPIVSGDRVFVTCAQDQGRKRSLYCFHRSDGEQLWRQTVKFDKIMPTHKTNPFCASTPLAVGNRVVVWHGSAGLFCYDRDGKELWSRDLGEFRHMWGYASSPVFYRDRIILNCGPGKRSFMTAVKLTTGRTLWQTDEPVEGDGDRNKDGKYAGSWSTPVIARVGGKDQIICSLATRVNGYDPDTGKILWTCDGLRGPKGDLVYSSPVVAGETCVVLGGFNGPSFGFKLGGSGNITEAGRLWRVERNPQNIGSGVFVGKHVYVPDAGPGTLRCIEPETGKVLWRERMPGGAAWGSIVYADGRCYVTCQDGDTVVFAPNPEGYKELAVNSLGEPSNSTPAVADGEIFMRTFKALYCIRAADAAGSAAAAPRTRPEYKPFKVTRPYRPPIVDAPVIAADEVEDQVTDNELVLGVVVGGEARAYPINMLTGPSREIINDTLGGRAIAATW